MTVTLLKSKIHRATVTDANLEYEGSISICPRLIDTAKFLLHERVDIYNCNNGEQLFHVLCDRRQRREICLNGAAARKVHKGDLVIIASYASMSVDEAQEFQPAVVLVNKENRPV